MKKLSILEINTMDTRGGAAQIVWQLTEQLRARGHSVSLLVGHRLSHDPAVYSTYDGSFNRLISSIIKKNFRARLQHHLTYWLANDIAWLPGKNIFKLKAFQTADIVHAHNLHSLFFNLKVLPKLTATKPFVWTLQDMWSLTGGAAHAFDCPHWPQGGCDCVLPNSLPRMRWNNSRHLWRLKKKIYRDAQIHIVAPSQWLYYQVKQSMLKDKPMTLIYNGIDTTIFNPGDQRQARKLLNLPLEKKIILLNSKKGSGNVWKGWPYSKTLIDKYRNDNRVLFVSLGQYEGGLTDSHAIDVPFTNDRQQLRNYYLASDLLLHPSVADTCPLAVLEAMACGLPVLTFETGGIPELVKHHVHGYVAKYRDSQDLQQGLEYLLSLTPDERREMVDRCIKQVQQNFSLEKMVNGYLELFQKITVSAAYK